jgi:hypothetical protein
VERDVGFRLRVSANRQDSNHRRLARAPRGGLRGLRPQPIRPPLQAAPSVETPRRAPPRPGTIASTPVPSRSPVLQFERDRLDSWLWDRKAAAHG